MVEWKCKIGDYGLPVLSKAAKSAILIYLIGCLKQGFHKSTKINFMEIFFVTIIQSLIFTENAILHLVLK